MRGIVSCVLVLVGFAGPLFAEENVEGLSPVVTEVIAAFRAGDEERLATLAARKEPDPWLVADSLLLRGETEAALAFARAAKGTDTARLGAYVLNRRERPHNRRVRAAIGLAEEAETPEAMERALDALNSQRGKGDLFEQVVLHHDCARLSVELGRTEAVPEMFLSCGDAAERLGWYSMAAEAFMLSFQYAHWANDYETSLNAARRLLGVQQGRADPGGVAHALHFVGGAYIEIGDHVRALRYLRESLEMLERLGDDDATAWVLNNLAMLYHRTGERAKEEETLERAIELALQVDNGFRYACLLADLGTLRFTLSDHEQAIALHSEALELFRRMEYEEGIAMCLGNMGESYRELGEHEKSLEHIEMALEISRKRNDLMFICAGLNDKGLTLLEMGELERALEFEEQSVEVGRRIAHPWYLGCALQSLADVLIALERYDEAKIRLNESLAIATQTGSPELLLLGHQGLAEMWLGKGDHSRAVYEAGRAMESVKDLLSGLAQGPSALARDQLAQLYGIAVDAAVGWKSTRALFSAMEAARAGALLETLENREEIRAAGISPERREEEAEARRQLSMRAARYQAAMESGDRREVRRRRAEVDFARERLHRIIGQIQREAKGAANVLYPRVAELEEVQAELKDDEAFVLYSLLGSEAVALVVTNRVEGGTLLGPIEPIEAAARRAVEDPSGDIGPAVAELRRLLIEPLELPERFERLLISPDGVLGFVPFALLAPDREISYVPSASAYRVLRREQKRRGVGVLALGDPEYRPAAGEPAATPERGPALHPLPGTRKEAMRVGDVVLLGKKATRGGFLKAVAARERWKAVHLACHGLVDSARPMHSALALAFEEEGGHLLTCADIYCLRIPADLAVLSACETGRGAVYRTEGIVGLTQAFMLAGAPRVLVSLWKVDDEATRALMVKFYELWRPRDGSTGLPAATALKRAQEHVRAIEKWKDPYYWAAWVLWGLPD